MWPVDGEPWFLVDARIHIGYDEDYLDQEVYSRHYICQKCNGPQNSKCNAHGLIEPQMRVCAALRLQAGPHRQSKRSKPYE
jgi:hypothetical protein